MVSRGSPPVFPRFLKKLTEPHALDRPARNARCRYDVQSFIPNAITRISFFHLPCNFFPFLRLRARDIGDDGPRERANGTGDECERICADRTSLVERSPVSSFLHINVHGCVNIHICWIKLPKTNTYAQHSANIFATCRHACCRTGPAQGTYVFANVNISSYM